MDYKASVWLPSLSDVIILFASIAGYFVTGSTQVLLSALVYQLLKPITLKQKIYELLLLIIGLALSYFTFTFANIKIFICSQLVLLLLQCLLPDGNFYKKKMARRSLLYLENVALLILTNLLVKDYKEKEYLYRKNINTTRQQFFSLMNAMPASEIKQALKNVYEILASLELILLRVEDRTTFEVISAELYELHKLMHEVFQSLGNEKRLLHAQTKLQNVMYNLQEVYDTAIQVVAKDPAPFLLWLQDWQLFSEEISRLQILFSNQMRRSA